MYLHRFYIFKLNPKKYIYTLLEKLPLAPVGEWLWYQFFEPIPPKWYQRLSLWYRVKQPVPKPSKFTQNILFGWDLNSRPLASHVAPLPSQLHSCSDRVGDIFLLKLPMDEPKVPVGNTNRYLRLIHKFHPPQKYRYGDEPVPISIPVLLGWT